VRGRSGPLRTGKPAVADELRTGRDAIGQDVWFFDRGRGGLDFGRARRCDNGSRCDPLLAHIPLALEHVTNDISMWLHVTLCMVSLIKRSLKLGHVSTSTRPSATALPGSRVSGAANSWFPFIEGVSLPTTSR
jgi:hypothetical protein